MAAAVDSRMTGTLVKIGGSDSSLVACMNIEVVRPDQLLVGDEEDEK
jgi:hypothetical protein